MSSLRCCFIALALCLLQALDSSDAYHKRHFLHKRYNMEKRSSEGVDEEPTQNGGYTFRSGIVFKEWSIEGETQGTQYGSVTLQCQAGGVPAPRFHWLKDGKRITQSGSCHSVEDDEEDEEVLNSGSGTRLSLYGTLSTLHLDCLDPMDEGNYTCVAEVPTSRKTRSTVLSVESSENPSMDTLRRCARKGEPAKIYMQTVSVLEYEGNAVQLLCRAKGKPAPKITWYDRNNETIHDGGHYKISRNGDLIIKDIAWLQHMGVYTCEAHNQYGLDRSEPFLYPTERDTQPFPMA